TSRPAEQWVVAKAKVEVVKLPAHARCPGLNETVIEARSFVPANRVVNVAPSASTMPRDVVAAAPAAKKAPVVVAAGQKIIIGGDRGGKKLIAVATGK